MKGLKGWTKGAIAGALVLALTIMAGASSAAAAPSVQYRVYYGVSQNGCVDWNAWLQKYLEQYYGGYKQPAVQQPVKQPVTQPVKQPVKQPAVQKPVPQQPAAQQPATPNKGTTDTSSYAAQVVNLVNQERAKAGLKPLTHNAQLANMALVKAKDMKVNNYFSHNSPTYGSPFDMMKQFGISYRYAGENIAMGQRTPQEVMKDWMNSPGHKANILNPNYTSIGVGYYQGAWVQEFIG